MRLAIILMCLLSASASAQLSNDAEMPVVTVHVVFVPFHTFQASIVGVRDPKSRADIAELPVTFVTFLSSIRTEYQYPGYDEFVAGTDRTVRRRWTYLAMQLEEAGGGSIFASPGGTAMNRFSLSPMFGTIVYFSPDKAQKINEYLNDPELLERLFRDDLVVKLHGATMEFLRIGDTEYVAFRAADDDYFEDYLVDFRLFKRLFKAGLKRTEYLRDKYVPERIVVDTTVVGTRLEG